MRLGTIVVTGAGGFVGSHLVRVLQRDGWDVVAVVRPGRSAPLGVRVVELDLDDRVETGGFPELDPLSPAAICHLAAFIPPRHDDPDEALRCLRINSLATLRLASWAARLGGCRFVYASTANLYAGGDGPADEEAPTFPADRAPYYLASKLTADVYVEHLRRTAGLVGLTLRFTSVFGLGMPEGSGVARFLSMAAAGGVINVWGGGTARYDWVYVSDVVWATAAALRGGLPGVYNIGSGRSHTVLEFAQTAAEVYADTGPRVCLQHADQFSDPGFRCVNIAKAVRTWGFAPRQLADAIQDYRRAAEAVR